MGFGHNQMVLTNKGYALLKGKTGFFENNIKAFDEHLLKVGKRNYYKEYRLNDSHMVTLSMDNGISVTVSKDTELITAGPELLFKTADKLTTTDDILCYSAFDSATFYARVKSVKPVTKGKNRIVISTKYPAIVNGVVLQGAKH